MQQINTVANLMHNMVSLSLEMMLMHNSQSITIYISAAPNLMAEREALARMIAELPVTLPWHIVQTPTEAEPIDGEALLAADLFFLIMGADIRAPVGLELHMASRAGRPVIAFLKRGVPYTPAGQIFTRQAQVTWRSFHDSANLRRQVQRVVIEHLLAQAIKYALTPDEVIQLEQRLKADTPAEQTVEGEGAGHSAVLLSRERYIPSDGVIIEES
jgi:hypothetical protein